MKYKSLALAVAALLSSTLVAAAADIASRMRVPEHYLDWNGLYGGVNAGYGMQDGTNAGGFMWGGTIGYNVRRGDLVLGAEGDYDWSNIRATSSNGPCAIAATGCQLSNNWIATVRGRIGYAFERYMPYLTGGLAFGNARIDS